MVDDLTPRIWQAASGIRDVRLGYAFVGCRQTSKISAVRDFPWQASVG